jgi:cell division protein FtsB
MTENNDISPEDLPEEDTSVPAGEEIFQEIKEDFDETLADPAIDSPEIPYHPEASLADMPEESPAGEEELAEVREPTRFQIFLRRALIWFGIAFVFFAAGFATFYFVLYQPKVAELKETQGKIMDLEIEIEQLHAEIREHEDEIADLEVKSAALEDAEKHTALLMVMVDAYDARFSLGAENVIAAKSTLADTDTALEMILDDIRGFDSGLADTLPQRLELIRTNLDRDVETAIEDCNQLIEDLLAVEAALYP